MSADPLSDVLRVVRLDGACFYAVEASEPWSVEVVAARDLTPRILPGAEHLISYHILTAGRCWGGLIGEPPVALGPGDVIVFPHGDAHLMSSAPGARVGNAPYGATPARYPQTVRLGNGGRAAATFVCGFLGCDRRPFNPLLSTLPRRLHLPGFSSGWHLSFAQQVVEESRARRAGADSVLTRLAELMFVEVIRRYIEDVPDPFPQAGTLPVRVLAPRGGHAHARHRPAARRRHRADALAAGSAHRPLVAVVSR